MEMLPKEDLLQYIWQYKFLLNQQLFTTEHKPIKVLRAGSLNTAQGPDFFDARIMIEETLWVGNIEIHVKSSDWKKHRHQFDPAYANIILHIVYVDDEDVVDLNRTSLPCLCLKPYLNQNLLFQFETLFYAKTSIPCETLFKPLDAELQNIFLERLLIERYQQKYKGIEWLLSCLEMDWEACAYALLFEYMGGGINKEPMVQVLRSIGTKLLKKYAHDTPLMEAILLGVSGLIKPNEISIRNQFEYVKQLHRLEPIPERQWKYSGLRPVSFPYQKLRLLAELLRVFNPVFQSLLNFNINATNNLTLSSGQRYKMDGLFINVILPLQYAFHRMMKEDDLEKYLTPLEGLDAETNKITRLYEPLGIKLKNAKESQGILQLNKYYCKEKKCLQCAFSLPIFRQA